MDDMPLNKNEMILPDLNKDTLLFKSGKIIHLGPSGETQTLGLADPNRAFYQLNYTLDIRFFCMIPCGERKS